MKKFTALLLTLILLLTLSACSLLPSLMPQPTPTPEPTPMPEAEPTAVPEPTAEPTPEPKTEEIAAALSLYRTLFETGMISVSENIWALTDCDVLAAAPETYSPYGDNPLTWMSDFLLCDIDCDQIPELVLESGAVERYIYIFKAENGKIQYKTSALSGNLEEVNYAFSVYRTEEGETQYYSIGIAGTGAGDLYFAYRILPDFSVEESFSRFIDPNGETCRINGADTQADDYEAAYAAHFDAMKLMEKLEFTPLGADPLASFDEAAYG